MSIELDTPYIFMEAFHWKNVGTRHPSKQEILVLLFSSLNECGGYLEETCYLLDSLGS